jgi:hypothetical protein
MPKSSPAKLKRKSFFIEERTLKRARKALGVGTDSEAVRVALARAVEMEDFWRFMDETRGELGADAFELP